MKKRRSLTAIWNDLNYYPIFGIFLINEFLDQILEFHTFQISGSHLGRVLGGFNWKYSNKIFAYERIIVASLEYAIQKNIKQVHYSMVDNYTKLRLLYCLEPCGLNFYFNNPVNRVLFKRTYPYNDDMGYICWNNRGFWNTVRKKEIERGTRRLF